MLGDSCAALHYFTADDVWRLLMQQEQEMLCSHP